MSTLTDSIKNTDRLNYINIGLILLSCGVAFFVPFELFLFSYAILGPAHYLTEISWLHERNYFSKGKRDYIFLGVAGIILFLLVYGKDLLHLILGENAKVPWFEGNTGTHLTTATVYIAFAASLFMVLLKDSFHRFIAFLVICATAFISKSMFLFFSVFLPTLIHVYIFTGLFMLYGALKGRSRSGYLSVLIFAIVPLLFIFITPHLFVLTDYAHEHYKKFHGVNLYALDLWDSNAYSFPATTQQGLDFVIASVYNSKAGLIIMRFIAFAYTYHYLNWFSKTTVIKWHQVPKKRLLIIGVLWAISVFFYIWKYELGFNILFLLSFLHVFLEFPLNHVTFIGIFKETRSIFSGKPVTPISVKGNSSKKKK